MDKNLYIWHIIHRFNRKSMEFSSRNPFETKPQFCFGYKKQIQTLMKHDLKHWNRSSLWSLVSGGDDQHPLGTSPGGSSSGAVGGSLWLHQAGASEHQTRLPTGCFFQEMELCTLWLCQNSYWKWPLIVDFPIKNGGSFHSYVKLPEGRWENQLQNQLGCRLFMIIQHQLGLSYRAGVTLSCKEYGVNTKAVQLPLVLPHHLVTYSVYSAPYNIL